MRYIVLAVVLVMLVVGTAVAEKPYFSNVITLHSATTTTGNSSQLSMGHVYPRITCLVTAAGTTTPNTAYFILKGAIDTERGSLVTIATHTASTFPSMFTHGSNTAYHLPAVRSILSTFVSYSLGGAVSLTDQTFTLKCRGSH